jgi:hypothetical protein
MRVLILMALVANLVVMLGRPGQTGAQPADKAGLGLKGPTVVVPENATITFAPGAKSLHFRPAKSERGAVVRLEVDNVTIDAVKMRVTHQGGVIPRAA